MKITIKYARKDFFGHTVYTEDETIVASVETALKATNKAFKYICDNAEETMQISDYDGEKSLVIWQEYGDLENDVLTVREYETFNSCDDVKQSKQAVKKAIRKICKEIEAA